MRLGKKEGLMWLTVPHGWVGLTIMAKGKNALLTWWWQDGMRKKRKRKPVINPSDLVRLKSLSWESHGKELPPLFNYLHLGLSRNMWNSGRHNSRWDLGADIAKPYQKHSMSKLMGCIKSCFKREFYNNKRIHVKKEGTQINNLMLHLKELEEDQTKPKFSRIKK